MRKDYQKMKTALKTNTILILTAAVLFCITACSTETATHGGTATFILEITDNNGNQTTKEIKTDKTTVGAALLEAGIIEGTVSDFGLMVEYVNGLRADFVEDNAWWAFYINGEMAMAGVDTTEIEEGVTYAFIFTPA